MLSSNIGVGENRILMKFDVFDKSKSFLGCAPDLTIRFACRAGASKKTSWSIVCSKFHVRGSVLEGAGLEVVSAPGVVK